MIKFCISAVIAFSLSAFAMEQNTIKSLLGKPIHWVDKNYVNPLDYITDILSIQLCDEILKYNCEHANHKKLVTDEETLLKIYRVFERQQKLLMVVENSICVTNTVDDVEHIIKHAPSGYQSPQVYATIHGFLHSKIEKNATSTPDFDFISPDTFAKLILGEKQNYIVKAISDTFNYVRKAKTDPVTYLTAHKSKTIAQAIVHFNPQHEHAWVLNPTLPLHTKLIHCAFERERRLLEQIESAIQNKDVNTIIQLYDNVEKSYFSPAALTIVKAYIALATHEKELINQMRRDQELKRLAGSMSSSISFTTTTANINQNDPATIPSQKEDDTKLAAFFNDTAKDTKEAKELLVKQEIKSFTNKKKS